MAWLSALLIAIGISVAGWAIAGQREPRRRPRPLVVAIASIVPALASVTVPTLGVLLLPSAIVAPALLSPRGRR